MTDTVRVHVAGLATIDAALRALPPAMREEILGAALRAGGDVLREGIAARIPERSGRTARDLRVVVQLEDGGLAGVAAIGAGPSGKGQTGRTHILNYLERGTQPHREPRPQKRLRRFERAAGKTLKGLNAAKRVAFGGRVYSRVNHPGTRAQAPMRLTIAEQGMAAIEAFAQRAWTGILATVGTRR